jgi:hypothetical protein
LSIPAERSISPGFIRNFTAIPIKPIVQFDSVIVKAAGTERLQKIGIRKFRVEIVESFLRI